MDINSKIHDMSSENHDISHIKILMSFGIMMKMVITYTQIYENLLPLVIL